MAFRNPMTALPGRTRLLLPVLATLVVLVIALLVFTSIYTNLLFFRSVHFSHVYTKVIWTRIILFLLCGLLVAAVTCGNAVVAYKIRPPFRPASLEQQNLDRYRLAVEPRLRLMLVILGGALTLFAGLAAQNKWSVVQQWLHGTKFNQTDPQFHRDISYFMFTYPMQRFVLNVAFVSVGLAILVSAIVHYLYGGIRLQTPGDKAVPAARAHLSVLVGVFVLLKAVAYYLDRFGLVYSDRGFVQGGASYTDVHVVLPAKTILLVIAIVCALLFFANIRLRGWFLPGIALGLLVFAAVIIGALVPAIVQHFSVKPNEVAKEQPYIQRNIDETRYAYGLANVKATPYDPSTASVAAAQADTNNLSNIRLLDPNQLTPTFDQLQQLKNYYSFPQTLDIDRYTFNGKLQDYIVAAREVNLSGLATNQQGWINQHLQYTHGDGLVAAPANTVTTAGTSTTAGAPDFSLGESNLPPTGRLNITGDGSQIYYGEQSPDYSIVNTKQTEVNGTDGSNHYDGDGGVKMSGINRLLFAIKFKDANFVLNSSITSSSLVQYYRNPRDRVQKVAPWLTLDGDPYPTVINNRITWVLDGYTTSDSFPYSASRQLGDVTADTTNTQQNANNAQQAQNNVNYIRNSVKATVDAQDGTVTLYAWDQADPLLQTWEKIFPGTVQPLSSMPPELLQHVRYPEDLFKVQRDILSQYHVTDPQIFYSGKEFWNIPADPSQQTTESQPPFYVVSQVPGQQSPQFNLTTTYVPQGGRRNLAAFLSVSSGPGDPNDKNSAYGAFTLLQLPDNTGEDGVPQIESKFNSSPAFSADRKLLSGNGSELIEGNLLTIPTGGGILYVEPVYLTGTSAANGQLPVLRKVLTSYDGTIGYGDTLTEALSQSFGQTAAPQGATVGGGTTTTTTPTATPTPSSSVTAAPTSASPTPSVSLPAGLPTSIPDLASQLAAAEAAQQQAASAGDYQAAINDQKKVQDLIAQLGRLASPATSPSAKASASP